MLTLAKLSATMLMVLCVVVRVLLCNFKGFIRVLGVLIVAVQFLGVSRL